MIKIKNYKEVANEVKGYLKDYLKLQNVEIKGRHFKCFAHYDKNASAGFTDDGRGFKCFTCETKGDIFTAYRILEGKRIDGKDFYYALKELADLFHVPYEIEATHKVVQEKEYVYTDGNNKEVYKVVKYHKEDENGDIIFKSNGKKEKVFSAYSKIDGIWERGMKGNKRYLYNLTNVADAISKGEYVYFAEGEKCADILKNEFGLTATTNPFGSKSWCDPYISNYKEQLKNAKLVLIADNDETGYKLMERIAKDLKDTAKSIKVVRLAEDMAIPNGGDIEEWIELGGNKERLLKLKEKSLEQIEQKKDWYQQDERGRIKINNGLLARHLVSNYPSIHSGGIFYIYKNGVYKACEQGEAYGIIKDKVDDNLCRMSMIKDVSGLWMIDKNVIKKPQELNPDPTIINVKNGLFNVITGEFKAHTPKYLSTIQLDVEYRLQAKGEIFQKFLDDILPSKESQLLIQEITGYTMSAYNKAKKFFIIHGKRDTGKTTFLNLITSILTKDNVSNINLQNLDDRFNKAELFGKLANIATELPDSGIRDVGFIKALVGQDCILGEKKNKDPFNFENKAKLIFACNNLPQNYGDKSDAFYNKMIIVRFGNQVSNDKIDVMLPEKLYKERDYVFLWAMEGLQRLIRNGFIFTETIESRELIEAHKVKSNNVISFVEDCCELEDKAQISSEELQMAYNNYCKLCNYKPLGRNIFIEELINIYSGKIIKQKITDKRINGYIGIKLK